MGWAQGLQSGMALGNLINQGFDRRELAEEAKKYRVDEVIPEQGKVNDLITERDAAAQRLIDEGLDSNTAYQQATQQYLPQLQETAQTAGLGRQYAYGGQNYADRGEAERAMSLGRTQGLANVFRTQGREEEASALEARAMQNRAAGLQIKGLERTEREKDLDETRKKEDATWWKSRLTDADGVQRAPTNEDWLAATQREAGSQFSKGDFEKGGAAYDKFMQRAEAQVVSQERERKRDGEKAFAAVQAGDVKAGMDFYNKYLPNGSIATDAKLDPKTGIISVKHTDMNGRPLPDTQINQQQLLQGIASFGDSKQALAYIQQSFMNNIQTQELGIKKEELGVKKKAVEQTGAYYQARIAAEKMGSAQTFNDDKGDTYLVVPKMGKNGISFETQKVNPEGSKFKKPGSEGANKPVKIEEEGTKMSMGGQTVIADGTGNWIPADGNGRPVGVLPSDRAKVLKDAGISDNLIGQLPWNKTGTGVLFNGKEYDVKDPKDLKLLTETYKRLGSAGIAMEESLAADLALQDRARRRGGLQPSIYAPEEDWRLYRNQERNRGLVPPLQ